MSVTLRILQLQKRALMAVMGARAACESAEKALDAGVKQDFMSAKAQLYRYELELINLQERMKVCCEDSDKVERVLHGH